MKEQVTRKKIFRKLFFMNNVRTSSRNSNAIFDLLKIKTSKDILRIEKCKVTFGFMCTTVFDVEWGYFIMLTKIILEQLPYGCDDLS